MFFRGSRYEGIAEAEMTAADGRIIRYKRVRFVPPTPGTFVYTVAAEDRPDLVTHKTLSNPELFWRICDANGVMRPDEMIAVPGRRLSIPTGLG